MRATLVGVVLSMAVLLPLVGNAQESTAWRYGNEPISVGGLIYYPTPGTRFFDVNAMSQVGLYRGVPVYEHVMQEPLILVYVPVGRGLVRTYERRAEAVAAPSEPAPVATSGENGQIPAPVPMTSTGALAVSDVPRTRVESVRPPSAVNGIWIEFNGARWYASASAAPFDQQRFNKIGDYHGFPVYREENNTTDIWVPRTHDGPLAKYSRR